MYEQLIKAHDAIVASGGNIPFIAFIDSFNNVISLVFVIVVNYLEVFCGTATIRVRRIYIICHVQSMIQLICDFNNIS